MYLDVGHGPDNKAIGIYDPGAVANGFTEAGVVRDVAEEVMRLVAPGIIKLAPDGYLPNRIRWQASHLGAKDLLLSLHMNAGGGRGVECYAAATKPDMRPRARALSSRFAALLGLPDRGARWDDMGQHTQIGILRVQGIPSLLLEMGFIDHLDDLQAVHAGAGKALAKLIAEGI